MALDSYICNQDTGFYYLQSRYYDPNIGRFLNADSYASTGQGVLGNNMFAYCLNNPVAHTDAAGSAAKTCLTADGAIDDTPWWDHSPGGGGINYHFDGITYDYSGDKLFAVILLKYLFNTDEQVVLDAQFVAFYKGQLVIREDWGITNGRSGSFFIMFLNTNETDPDTVRHEWGHFVQLRLMGVTSFIPTVAIPSILFGKRTDYYSLPWERMADYLGGVNRKEGYAQGSLAWGVAQFFLGPVSVPLYELFGR